MTIYNIISYLTKSISGIYTCNKNDFDFIFPLFYIKIKLKMEIDVIVTVALNCFTVNRRTEV